MTRSRETTLARVWKNPPTSKRYIMALKTKSPIDRDIRVYDQTEQRFVEDDELASIDVDAKMRLP